MKRFIYTIICLIFAFCGFACDIGDDSSVCVHEYKIKVVREATCTEKGIIERVCENCEDVIVAYTELIPHVYENGVCKECGFNTNSQESESSSNTSEDIGGDSSGDVSSEGESSSSNSGETICEHEYEYRIVREATCQQEGIKECVCSKCQEPKGQPETIGKTKHNFEDAKCTVCGFEDDKWTDFE